MNTPTKFTSRSIMRCAQMAFALIIISEASRLDVKAQSSIQWTLKHSASWPCLAVAATPVNPAVVLTEDEFDIYRSTNAGNSWNNVTPASSTPPGSAFAVIPGDPNTIYAGRWYGLLKSVDGGATWFKLTDTDTGGAGPSAIVIDPLNTSVVYAGMSAGWGIYKSSNAGATWTNPITSTDVRSMAIHPTNTAILFAGTANYYSTPGGILKSVNGGLNWSLVWANAQVNAIVVDPVTPNVVYAGLQSGGVVRSTDLGATWSVIGTALTNIPVSALIVDPIYHNQIYATSGGSGFYMSSDAGNTWTAMNAGLTDLNCVCMARHAPSGTLYVGTYSGYLFSGTPPSTPSVPPGIASIHMYSGLTITGAVASVCSVQASTNLASWNTIASFSLPSSPYLFIDTNSPNYLGRFYRVTSGQ
jgi:photosystem II stability/assembly factor-like uncharacterized protein